MSTWLVNYGGFDHTPKSLGLTLLGGEWRSGGPSTVRLKAARKFDASELFDYGTAVTLKRDGNAWFRGTVRPITKSAAGGREAHDYLLEDAWADLEIQTYQEPWFIRQTDYTGPAWSPRVILGVNSSGTRITVGAQISEVIDFAISVGISIQAGSIPSGMLLWPTPVTGMSCAELIRTSLRYYPDWIPWLDHSTTPPTFNVTPRSSATARTRSVIGAAGLNVTKLNDRVPTGVRVVYETATMIDDEVYRTMQIDQAPAPTGTTAEILAILTAPAGPGMLVTTVELQGLQQQIQKQQVVTRTLPVDQSTAKEYLKVKFPIVKDLADTDWNVTAWSTAVIPEDDDEIDPIDVKLERHYGADRTDLPRELVKGAVAEWMQKKVGRVLVEFTVVASGTATAAEAKKISELPTHFTVTATNAVTKIYKGISGYQSGDDVPVGIAAAYLATIQNGCNFAGSIRIKENDVGATRWHGSKLNVSGGASEWATMDAPIHSVVWDLRTKDVEIGFGPNPDYSVQDYLEFLRLLNKRDHTNYTTSERTSDELGSESSVSARGDSAGVLDTPETVTGGGGGVSGSSQPFALVASGTPGDNVLNVRESTIAGDSPSGFTAGLMPLTIADSAGVVYAKLTINGTTGAVTAVAVEKATTMPSATATVHYEQLGSYTVTGSGGSAVIAATNTRYGPVPATICRNWFAAEAPFYGVTFS